MSPRFLCMCISNTVSTEIKVLSKLAWYGTGFVTRVYYIL